MAKFSCLATGVVAVAAAIGFSFPAAAQSAPTSCSTVDELGLRRFEQFRSLVEECDRARNEGTARRTRSISSAAPVPQELPEGYFTGTRKRAIYSNVSLDDRIEAEQLTARIKHPKLEQISKAVKATAALVLSTSLTRAGAMYRLQLQPYRENNVRLCQGETFAEQRIASRCTVFLVAPSLVATAGHCIRDVDINEAAPNRGKFSIVFGFETRRGVERTDYEPDEVFTIARLIERYQQGAANALRDYAVLELDRPVPSRIAQPLRLAERAGLSIDANTRLGVIGHPSGLAKKVSGFHNESRSQAMETGEGFSFRAQLNTFKGNSGSPVIFYNDPDVVAGILVQGEEDFIQQSDAQGLCLRHAIYGTDQICKNGQRCAERVTKSAMIEPYVFD